MTYEIKLIRTETDYQNALARIESFFDNEPEPGSEAGDFFEILLMLIEKYEAEHYAIDPPHPIEAIKFRMEQQHLSVKDIAPAFGMANRAYEVLNLKRKLTLPMIRNLHQMYNIPAASLIKEYVAAGNNTEDIQDIPQIRCQ